MTFIQKKGGNYVKKDIWNVLGNEILLITRRKYEQGIVQFNNFYDLEGKIILLNSARKGFYENKETDH